MKHGKEDQNLDINAGNPGDILHKVPERVHPVRTRPNSDRRTALLHKKMHDICE